MKTHQWTEGRFLCLALEYFIVNEDEDKRRIAETFSDYAAEAIDGFLKRPKTTLLKYRVHSFSIKLV